MSMLSKGIKKLGSNLNRIAGPLTLGNLAGKVTGVATGGLAGTAISLASSALTKSKGAGPSPVISLPTHTGSGPGLDLSDFGDLIRRVVPGGAHGRGKVSPVGGQCPVGYHFNKQDGPNGPARTYCVRNRSMNPGNPRALRRAASRVEGGVKMYKRLLSIRGTPAKGKVVPKRRGK